MKRMKFCAVASIALAVFTVAPMASASIYGPGEGYYYITRAYVGGFPTAYNYMNVGPFAEKDDCLAARAVDQGNGDAWIPYSGTGIQCTWVFHNEVGSLYDAVDLWNNPISNGGGGPGYLDAARLESIAVLRDGYGIDGYEAELKRILTPQR